MQKQLCTRMSSDEARTQNESKSPGNNNNFVTTVTIPSDAYLNDCSDENNPCVLQLFDLYYFVSCANVVLTFDDMDIDEYYNNLNNNGETSLTSSNPFTSFAAVDRALQDLDNEGLYEYTTFDPNVSLLRIEAKSFINYSVSSTEGMFVGLSDPTLDLKRCHTYIIGLYTPGHPLVIKTKSGIGLEDDLYEYQPIPIPKIVSSTTGGEEEGASASPDGIEQGLYEFRIPIQKEGGGPSTLYYQCTLHEDMVGTINIVGDDETDGFDTCEEYLASLPSSSPATTSFMATGGFMTVATATSLAVMLQLFFTSIIV